MKITSFDAETDISIELKNSNPICINKCAACENTLYYLKFHNKIDCNYSQCPELCVSITNEFYSNKTPHIEFYKNNEISVCDTCFRLNICHRNECIQQEKIAHETIASSLMEFPKLHMLRMLDNKINNNINKISEDYSFNIELVLKSMEKILSNLQDYNTLYNMTESLKSIYIEFYQNDKGIISLPTKEMNKIEFAFQFSKYRKLLDDFLNVYDSELDPKQFKLYKNTFYNSEQIAKKSFLLNKYKNLDDKLKNLLDDGDSMLENLRRSIIDNINLVGEMKHDLLKIRLNPEEKNITEDVIKNKTNRFSFENKTSFNLLKDEDNQTNLSPNFHTNSHKNFKIESTTYGPSNFKNFIFKDKTSKNIQNNLIKNKILPKINSLNKHNMNSLLLNHINKIKNNRITNKNMDNVNIISNVKKNNDLKNYNDLITFMHNNPITLSNLKLIDNEKFTSETPVKEYKLKDLDTLVDRRKKLMKNSALWKKKIDIDTFRKDLEVNENIKKGIYQIHEGSYHKIVKDSIFHKEIDGGISSNTKKKKGDINNTIHYKDLNKTLNYINESSLTYNRIKNLLQTLQSAINDTDYSKKPKIQSFYSDYPSTINIFSYSNKTPTNFNRKNTNKKLDMDNSTSVNLFQTKQIHKNIGIPPLVRNNINKTMFFLEKSTKYTDDELFFLTQNLYPELIID